VIRTYIVAGVGPYRDALEEALERSGRVEVVGRAAHPADALGELGPSGARVGLLDVPGPEGPAWAADLAAASPELRLIALGLDEAERDILAWAHAGVAGYIGREACLEELLSAIEAIAEDEAPTTSPTGALRIHPVARGPRDRWDGDGHLTTREREILRLIGEGRTNRDIATELSVALPTVKNHVHNMLEKLGVHRRTDAVRAIRRAGFVSWTRQPSRSGRGDGSAARVSTEATVGSRG
jgi:two-component system, NarL family, nitrate/nitrite response regulator NarL